MAMDRGFFRGAWKIAVIMGIPIRIHFSWLIVFGLITWSLSTFYFPHVAPDLPVASYWMKGVLAALLLFASVAFHELSHSFVAQRYAISIESITLFVFGGVAQMKGEPPHPKAEFWIALAGPLSSIFLSAIFYLYRNLFSFYPNARWVMAYAHRVVSLLGCPDKLPAIKPSGNPFRR